MKDETKKEDKKPEQPNEKFVQVAVITTSGSYPDQGFDRTPENQKIRVILEQTARKLKITDTSGWVALVGDKELNIEANFVENGLQGEVEIDYGPREGGGGCA